MGEFSAVTIRGFGKVAAADASTLIFTGWLEIAAGLTVIPIVAAADIAVQAVGIDAKGIGLVVAIDVPGHGVAEQSAQHGTTDHGAAIAMADGRANQTTSDSAEDGAGGSVAAVAVLLIFALAVVGGALAVAIVALVILRSHAAIAALIVVITVLIGLAVIAIRVALRSVILG